MKAKDWNKGVKQWNKDEGLKPQHTPTPWEVLSGEVVKQGYGPNGNIAIIAKADRTAGNGTSAVERDENMAFIVRAVNSHEELLRASKLALEVLQRELNDGHVQQGLRKAIAKAEGVAHAPEGKQ